MPNMRTLTLPMKLETRDDEGTAKIEGYFAVYNDVYEIAPGMSESIAPGAFQDSLSGDVRMLINHNTDLVIARTAAGTMELRDDNHGLFAIAQVNPNDRAAMDEYARIQRGDVTQASIGFEIIDEEAEYRDDDSVHWTIRKAKLWEVSPCTFPAYENTNISAREKDRKEARKRRSDFWAENALRRLKNGT